LRYVGRAILALIALIALLLAVPVMFMALNIPIDLQPLKKPLTKLASAEFGLNVRIDGALSLVPGLEPSLEMHGLAITDPRHAESANAINLGLARVRLDLLALILGGVRIEELTAEDIRVVAVLEASDDAPHLPEAAPGAVAPAGPESSTERGDSALVFEALAALALRRLSVDLKDQKSGKHHRFVLSELTGAASSGEPLALQAHGTYQEQPFQIALRGESVEKILLLKWTWPIDMSANVAGMSVQLTPLSDVDTSTSKTQLDYALSVKGNSFADLNAIAGMALPPLGPYSISGRFTVADDRYSVSDVALRLGNSDLNGSVEVDLSGDALALAIDFSADTLRLADFDAGDWSPTEADTQSASVPKKPDGSALSGKTDSEAVVSFFNPELLKGFSLQLALAVNQIQSRQGNLGSGTLALNMEGGAITIDPLKITLPRGELEFAIGLDPVSLSASKMSAILPAYVSAKAGDTVIRFDRLDGKAGTGSDDTAQLRYRVDVRGKSLAQLDSYAGVSLPPMGPYALTSLISVSDTFFALSELAIRIGQSSMNGTMRLDVSGDRPRADVNLHTSVLQLEDFIFDDWKMMNGAEESATKQQEPVGTASAGARDQIDTLLSRDSMMRMNANFSLNVARVLLGEEEMGGGQLGLSLENGRLEVKPVRLDIPGGALNMSFSLEPTETDMAAEFVIDVDHFDYGVLARRHRPDTDMGGHISVDASLATRAKSGDEMLRTANGHLLFGIWPDNIEADVFDLWTVNLLLAVMPTVDEGPQSKVNCVIAGLAFQDGVATQRALLMDTTNMQVAGDVEANFTTEKVHVYLKPQAKVPQFFSLATPVQVDGNFSDFGVSPAPGALIGTVIRVLTSIVTVPVQHLFREEIPEDGETACAVAYQGGIPEGR
jgi:uncharacterized protein involved in outer membrane biogenesis